MNLNISIHSPVSGGQLLKSRICLPIITVILSSISGRGHPLPGPSGLFLSFSTSCTEGHWNWYHSSNTKNNVSSNLNPFFCPKIKVSSVFKRVFCTLSGKLYREFLFIAYLESERLKDTLLEEILLFSFFLSFWSDVSLFTPPSSLHSAGLHVNWIFCRFCFFFLQVLVHITCSRTWRTK